MHFQPLHPCIALFLLFTLLLLDSYSDSEAGLIRKCARVRRENLTQSDALAQAFRGEQAPPLTPH